MQKKWVTEVIADFRDKDKYQIIDALMKRHAAQINAALMLIKDEQRPRVAVFSEDFFTGRDELDFLAVDPLHVAVDKLATDEPISDEMMEMLGKK